MRARHFKILVGLAIAGALLAAVVGAVAAKVGQSLSNVSIKDAEDNPTQIPDFGHKVLFIIYADSQAADDNDPVAEAVRNAKLDQSKLRGLGIANMKDSWVPDAIIRMVIRKKIKQFNRTILTDDNHIVASAWGLGDCDDKSVVLLIGKDKKLKYIKKGKVKGAEIQQVVDLVTAEVDAS
jgi:predicted transcriptional regulator